MKVMTEQHQSETIDSAIIVTHLDGTQERFPVKLSRVQQEPETKQGEEEA